MLRTGLVALATLTCLFGPAAGTAHAELSKAGFKKLKKQIQYAIKQQKHDELAKHLHELATDDSKRAVDLFLAAAVSAPTGTVFKAIEHGLSKMTSSEATGAIIAKVEKKGGHPVAKVLCIDALGERDDGASGEALGAALNDKRPEILRAALSAIKKRKAVGAVDAMIDLFGRIKKKPDALLLNAVTTTLHAITGKYYDNTADWKKFWDNARDGFRPATGPDVKPLTTAERTGRTEVPTFYGTEIVSERVVFVIDTSGSMEGPKLAGMQRQLKECIEGLSKKSRFTIVSYGTQIKVWKPKLQVATPANKAKGKEYADRLKAEGLTHTLSAFKEAFNIEGADSIVLLSDGIPTEKDDNGERITEDTILNEVDGENRAKKWRVDTFGIAADMPALEDFMKSLAENNDGKYTAIN